VFEVLDAPLLIQSPAAPKRLGVVRGGVRLENVTFAHAGHTVLQDVSLAAAPGECIAIVGATGSGKSALLSLIPRFYDPSAGRVLLDDVDVHALDLRELRRSVGIVFQDNFPPRTCEISDGGLKFHDRSHILTQDFLGLNSWDLQRVFNETSIPSVFEEILTFFSAKILYSLDDDAQKFVSVDVAKSDIQAMKHLE
jgi:ABC-type oligopeptide transport system ATPase subunit